MCVYVCVCARVAHGTECVRVCVCACVCACMRVRARVAHGNAHDFVCITLLVK